MAEQKKINFLENCIGQKVKYVDSRRKQIFEGTLQYDSVIELYTIATGGRNKPIVCHESAAKDFIVDDGEILDFNGRYECLDDVTLDEQAGVCYLSESDSRLKLERYSTIEIETGKILDEATDEPLFYD